MFRVLKTPFTILVPAALSIALGPIAGPKLRQSLLIATGDAAILLTRLIAGPFTIVAIILLLLPLIRVIHRK